MIVSLIAAFSESDRAIGYQGKLPWHLPADLARFKRITMGHTLLMGRKTFHSLQGRRLPGRKIIVLTNTLKSTPPGADEISPDLMAALRQAQFQFKDEEPFIAGGAQIYRQALAKDLVDRLYLTLVQASVQADTFFPEIDMDQWRLVESDQLQADESNRYDMTFQILERDRAKAAA